MEEKHLQQGGAARRLYYEDSHLKEFPCRRPVL